MKKTKADQNKQTLRVQKKIKRLRKVKIWPSIAFYSISFLITIISVLTLVSLFVSYIFQEKFDSAFQRTQYIETTIENSLAQNKSYQAAITFLHEDGSINNSVAVLDKEYNLITGYGKMSYDLTREVTFEFMEQYRFYLDQEATGEIFDKNGKLLLNIRKLLKFFGREQEVDDKQWLNTLIFNEAYWLVIPDQTNDLWILVCNELSLTRKDILFICGIGIGILVVMCIPLLFLFFHVFSGIFKQRRMYRLLSIDSVTGGYNWFYFNNRVDKILNRSWSFDKTYAVIHLTYGKYRSYCTCHGSQAGEILLQRLDQFLTGKLKKGELCAHTSEADFALLIRCHSREEAGDRIKLWFEEIPGVIPQCHSSFRAGICMVEAPNQVENNKNKRRNVDVSQLYHNASIARDAIPESEEKGILLFDDEMRAQQVWEHHVEENMERALIAEEFHVYLQPKYNPVTEELTGAEALVRWISPEDGLIPPYRFIPIFEKDGFITRLDDYMISHVAALQKRWLSEGRKVVPVSVNVSRAHFTRLDLAEHICHLVDQYQLPHELLEIELTESAFFDDKEVLLQTVNSLKQYGFPVSMDDFGAGYSSLNSLKELPLDVLKLDAEFFRGHYEKERGDIIVSEAIRLAKKLNMKIVAEGIEEQEQVIFLAKLGCDMIQGYYFAKPMPVHEYELRMG